MHALTLTLLATLASANPAKVIDRTLPAAAAATVDIDNVAGSVRVEAWDRGEVSVHAELFGRLDAVETSGSPDAIRVHVPYPPGDSGSADLTVRVPVAGHVKIHGVSASIAVTGVKGPAEVESVSGGVHVEGDTRSLSASTVSGDIDLQGRLGDVKAHTVSGGVRGGTASGSVDTETTSGDVQLIGQGVSSVSARSVSGTVRFHGSLAANASVHIKSMSGSVELGLPATTAMELTATTFSGEIVNAFSDAAPSTSRFGPGKSLSFGSGSKAARIQLETFSGSVRLAKE